MLSIIMTFAAFISTRIATLRLERTAGGLAARFVEFTEDTDYPLTGVILKPTMFNAEGLITNADVIGMILEDLGIEITGEDGDGDERAPLTAPDQNENDEREHFWCPARGGVRWLERQSDQRLAEFIGWAKVLLSVMASHEALIERAIMARRSRGLDNGGLHPSNVKQGWGDFSLIWSELMPGPGMEPGDPPCFFWSLKSDSATGVSRRTAEGLRMLIEGVQDTLEERERERRREEILAEENERLRDARLRKLRALGYEGKQAERALKALQGTPALGWLTSGQHDDSVLRIVVGGIVG